MLDEVHRLPDPSETLKIVADHFPHVRIVATGSSVLGASSRFRDTLTGRKRVLWLTPLCLADLHDFHAQGLRHRLHHGGLPPFFLAKAFPEADVQEWMDAYWAKDVLELFRLERRHSFAHLGQRTVQYWRTKQGHEIDFIFAQRGREPIAIECKWSVRDFDPGNLHAFRRFYPKGVNLVGAADPGPSFERRWSDLVVRFISLEELPSLLGA